MLSNPVFGVWILHTFNQDGFVSIFTCSIDSGLSAEDAKSEAQVTALISSLFLTHRGYAEVSQDLDGNISLKNLHLRDDDFSALTNRLNPKVRITEGVISNE